MRSMPVAVVVAVFLAGLVGVEALGVLGYWAFTGSGRGPESAGVFIGGVILMVQVGHFIAGAVHRRAAARTAALRKAIPVAAIAAVIVAIGSSLDEDPIPARLALASGLGAIVPLAAIGLLLLGRSARSWFDRAGPAA